MGSKLSEWPRLHTRQQMYPNPVLFPSPHPSNALGRTQLVPGNLTIRPIGRGLEIFRALRSNSTTLLPCKMFILWDWMVETWKFLSMASSFMEFNGCFVIGDVQLFFIRFICICFCGCFFKGCVFLGEQFKKPTTFSVEKGSWWIKPLNFQKVGAGDGYSLTHG